MVANGWLPSARHARSSFTLRRRESLVGASAEVARTRSVAWRRERHEDPVGLAGMAGLSRGRGTAVVLPGFAPGRALPSAGRRSGQGECGARPREGDTPGGPVRDQAAHCGHDLGQGFATADPTLQRPPLLRLGDGVFHHDPPLGLAAAGAVVVASLSPGPAPLAGFFGGALTWWGKARANPVQPVSTSAFTMGCSRSCASLPSARTWVTSCIRPGSTAPSHRPRPCSSLITVTFSVFCFFFPDT